MNELNASLYPQNPTNDNNLMFLLFFLLLFNGGSGGSGGFGGLMGDGKAGGMFGGDNIILILLIFMFMGM